MGDICSPLRRAVSQCGKLDGSRGQHLPRKHGEGRWANVEMHRFDCSSEL